MFPGALRVIHAGHLREPELLANGLCVATSEISDFRDLWHVPSEVDPDKETMFTIPEPDMPSWENDLPRFRMLLNNDCHCDAKHQTRQFVLEVAFPCDYPPAPPSVTVYGNVYMPPSEQTRLKAECLQTLIDSHPLFSERIIPLCELLTDKLRTLGVNPFAREWSSKPSSKTLDTSPKVETRKMPSVENIADIEGDESVSEENMISARNRFHADVLKELELLQDEQELDDGDLDDYCGDLSRAPSISSRYDRIANVYRRPNPLEVYVFDKEKLAAADGDASGTKQARRSRRRRKAPVTGPPDTDTPKRLESKQFSTYSSRYRKETGRFGSDFDSVVSVESTNCVSIFTGRNKVDQEEYVIAVVRAERALMLLSPLPPDERTVQSCCDLIIGGLQSFSHVDHPHLARINSMWSESLRLGGGPAGIDRGTRQLPLRSLTIDSDVISFDDQEMCVCVQMDGRYRSLSLLESSEGARLLQRDKLMPTRIAQQILEVLAFLHRQGLAYLGVLKEARFELDDVGIKLTLAPPNMAVLMALTIPSLLSCTKAVSSPYVRQSNRPEQEATANLHNILQLPKNMKTLLLEHADACQGLCKLAEGPCAELKHLDLKAFCEFYRQLVGDDSDEMSQELCTIAEMPLTQIPSAEELLQKTTPLISRDTFRDFLLQVGDVNSVDGKATAGALLRCVSLRARAAVFFLQSRENELGHFWDNRFPDISSNLREIELELKRSRSQAGPREAVWKEFSAALHQINFLSYTDSCHVSSIIYKDVLSYQIIGSAIESLSGFQIELPCLLPFTANWIIPETLLEKLVGTVEDRTLHTFEIIEFLGLSPWSRPAAYISSESLKLGLPRSLVESLHCMSREVETDQLYISVDSAYQQGSHFGHPHTSLRSLAFTLEESDRTEIESGLLELLVATEIMSSPWRRKCMGLSLDFHFPNFLGSLLESLLPEYEHDLEDIHLSISFGMPVNDRWKDHRNYPRVLMIESVANRRSLDSMGAISTLNFLSDVLSHSGCASIIKSQMELIEVIDAYTQEQATTFASVQYDLFASTINPLFSKRSNVYFTLKMMTADRPCLVGVGGRAERHSCPYYFVEMSIEAVAAVINAHETVLLSDFYLGKTSLPNFTLLSDIRTSQALIVIQRWSLWREGLSLTSRLQLLGLPSECRARPVVNLVVLKSELPQISGGINYIVFLKQPASNGSVAYRVEVSTTEKSWTSVTLKTEAEVVHFLLGQAARAKGNVRSQVLAITKHVVSA